MPYTTNPTEGTFGQYLVSQNLLTQKQWLLVAMEQQVTGRSLAGVVSSLGFMNHDDLVRAMLTFGAEDIFAEERFTNKISAKTLVQLNTMVVAEQEDTLYLATTNPVTFVQEYILLEAPHLKLKFVPASPARIKAYLQRLQASSASELLLEGLLQRAAAKNASDIHIIPKENSYLVMFRFLGVRYPEHEGSLLEYAHLASRIKDQSRLDLAERRMPQDGSFTFSYDARQIDLRVATVPTIHGEYLVLRLLDPANYAKSITDLGISALPNWLKGISRADGLCLVCGPTGSGKTTTLNSTIKHLDRFDSAVFTAEDPVEARLPLTGQVNVVPSIGLDFSRALKAFMRADPDIIVLGEIRDGDTARNAIKAAETGHLVLATLHTESIHGAVQRLRDLGVPEYELVYLLRAILVQRLVRVQCQQCLGEGCPTCKGYGYVGRTIVSECTYFQDEKAVKDMLAGDVGWTTLLEDALAKAEAGITSSKEIARVFGAAALDHLPGAQRG